MTMGEIGCYLSHYRIWEEVNSLGFIWSQSGIIISSFIVQQIVERKLERSIIFEDDVKFERKFLQNYYGVMQEIETLRLDYDLM